MKERLRQNKVSILLPQLDRRALPVDLLSKALEVRNEG